MASDAASNGSGGGGSRDVERIAADWLARRDGDAWTDADARALQAWLSAATAHHVAFLRLDAAWNECGRLQALGAGVREGPPAREHWGEHGAPHVHADAPPTGAGTPDMSGVVFTSPRIARRARWPVAAALAALAVFAVALPMAWQHATAIDASSHRTVPGAIRTVPLADGSRTTLGSDSRIDVRLSRRQRQVELLKGEAFFAAARDPRRPFVVQAGERRVVAVGTRFSVRMDGRDLRVVVTEGSVRLESADRSAATVLPAGSVALATPAGLLVTAGTVAEAERMVGWMDGVLVFRDTALSDAVAEFNRYSARRIVVADASVGALRIGGSFRWSNAEGFVRLLEQGFPVRADHGREEIVLHAR